jgi:membrane protease YdiL (CAAX protease family)
MTQEISSLESESRPGIRFILASFLKKLALSARVSVLHAWRAFPRYPLLAAFLLGYLGLRLGILLWLGSSLGIALRSAIFGFAFYGMAILVIDTIHHYRRGSFIDASTYASTWERVNWKALLVLLFVWAFWGLWIIDSLQRRGSVPGGPILNALLGWDGLQGLIQSLSQLLSGLLPLWSSAIFYNILANLLFIVLLPLALMAFCGYRPKDFSLSLKGWSVAAPFVLFLGLAFLASQPTLGKVAILAYALIYPGLTEELFYRGLLQRSLRGWFKPLNAILISSLLFGALHFPSYYYEIYSANLGLALLNIGDACLFSVFMGYGFMRSGGILPWAAIHALNDMLGI